MQTSLPKLSELEIAEAWAKIDEAERDLRDKANATLKQLEAEARKLNAELRQLNVNSKEFCLLEFR